MSYDAATQLARALLARKGAKATLTRKGAAIDEIAGTRAPGGNQTATFNCLGLPPGKGAEKEVGSLVDRRLTEFHLARTSGSLEPMPGDALGFAGADWTLVWTANYDPDGRGLVYSKAYGER